MSGILFYFSIYLSSIYGYKWKKIFPCIKIMKEITKEKVDEFSYTKL